MGFREMGCRWNVFRLGLHKFLWFFLTLQLLIEGCTSLNLEGWALLKFRSGVKVDPHDALRNWNTKDSDACGWFGVHCVDGKVVALNLKGLSLEGNLASELGKLSHLRYLVLYKNNFSGAIPKEIARLTMLELLDLRVNNLSGTVPTEIGEMTSLKNFLYCNNKFHGIPHFIEKHNMIVEQQCDRALSFDLDSRLLCINRKIGHCIWQSGLQQLKKYNISVTPIRGNLLHFLNIMSLFKFKSHSSSHGHGDANVLKIPSVTKQSFRRMLLEEMCNLPAAPGGGIIQEVITVPSIGSGSFPAFPAVLGSAKGNGKDQPLGPTAAASFRDPIPHLFAKPTNTMDNGSPLREWFGKWAYVLVLPGVVLLFAAVGSTLACRQQGVATIGPWRTGLSGQLQKAFIAGVPKLNRSELEAACEDFSNIVITFPECTVFKGTLSSGVEISVISTCVSSAKDWSRRSEVRFRKMVDMLSRVNHKNFVNLLGYCEENEPFMRMMVFEYAPNGTLFEHLHVKEFEQLDWSARMRIIMGIAYCLQYMHHELSPPVTLTDLQSTAVFMTDDYAAKVAETSIWKEIAKRKISGDDDVDPSGASYVDPRSNVYSFGILMLEVISGKVAYTEEQGSLLNWATEYLNDKRNIKRLADPMLKNYKNEELDVVVEIIQECIHRDPKDRPTMKEVTARLKEVLAISPDAAAPRLSPLWWAELEILSVEAN